ncbi:MAG TPA: hypothetical protein VNX26_02300 [Candidatus Acidoferrum sp.]|jgi:hypothetical protein|nr:hypothetical protein [Candidatus Acidoferrum sp.]
MASRSVTHHYSLKGRHPAGEITMPITRAEALALFTKWMDTARRRARKGHRTLYLVHAHKGHCFDRLVIETTHARMRSHVEKQAHADSHKPWVTR